MSAPKSNNSKSVELDIRFNLNIKEKNIKYLNILNARLKNQQLKLQEQQNTIEDNRLWEKMLQNYIKKKICDQTEFWNSVYDQQQGILQEMQNEVVSAQITNENIENNMLSEFINNQQTSYELYQDESERAAFHQMIPSNIFHNEHNYEIQQFPTNYHQEMQIDWDFGEAVNEDTNVPFSTHQQRTQNHSYQNETDMPATAPTTFNEEYSYEYFELPPNNQTDIATEESRLNNLKSFRESLEADIRALHQAQYEKAEILRVSQEQLRKYRQQLIQRHEIERMIED